MTTAEEIAQLRAVIAKVLEKGQAWTVDGEKFERPDLETLYSRLSKLEGREVTEGRGGIRTRYGVPGP